MTRTLLATAWVVLLSTAASLQGQSLAGAARKAEENRAKAKQEQPADATKADKPPTKVYTNEDLAAVPPAAVATSPTPETAAPSSNSSKATSGGETTSTKKDEDWWRSRAVALRRTLADDQTKLAAAKQYYDGLPPEAKGAVGAPIVSAWMKAKEEITRLTAVVANDQRAVDEFENEGRRAGALPGWLREK